MIKKILLLLSLGALLWSCTDNDDYDYGYEYDMILGYWQFSQNTPVEIIADPVAAIPAIDREVRNSCHNDWEFYDNGVAVEYRELGPVRYEYYFDRGNLVVINLKYGDVEFSVPVEITRNTLSMYFDETADLQDLFYDVYVKSVITQAVFRRR